MAVVITPTVTIAVVVAAVPVVIETPYRVKQLAEADQPKVLSQSQKARPTQSRSVLVVLEAHTKHKAMQAATAS